MKASEVIAVMTTIITRYGDLPVALKAPDIDGQESYIDIASVSVANYLADRENRDEAIRLILVE